MSGKYEMTVGIECHVQLATRTKLFSAVDNDAREKEPNACVSPVDYALPGMLPLLNARAVELAVRAGYALGAKINQRSHFDRKHYFYPDLPKGYQTSQFYKPIIGEGKVVLANGHEVRVEHAHLEEDAGKLTHFGDYSLVDLNRAGTPLLEIVSMPDIHSAEDARLYAEELWRLMTYAGVSYGDLYHGNMRFDVNISVAPVGAKKLGTRVEIKNLNSFRSVERAAAYEFGRQTELIEAGRGGEIRQETRGWSDATGKTTAQRSKEQAQDYRYMPDPDVPPLNLAEEYIAGVLAEMPKLPEDYRAAFREAGVPSEIVELILDRQSYAELLMAVLEESDAATGKIVANWLASVVMDEAPTAEQLLELAKMVQGSEVSQTAAKELLVNFSDGKTARELAKEMNLLQENDDAALEKIIDGVMASPAAAAAVADVRAGEMKAVGFLIGLIMKESGGKANPARARELLLKKLG
ncbi:Asp-tRNA(Asn)/Glu-tRNA(Gln) amidotransferase subunit GatB [Candidatus Saccharibacteria bacterium]|nr:Asp-tRNA(Asn)/Glu-tRNA(Gln) amidotransferase subunit GatB [Candidatus Saccharibacteria bacterium]